MFKRKILSEFEAWKNSGLSIPRPSAEIVDGQVLAKLSDY